MRSASKQKSGCVTVIAFSWRALIDSLEITRFCRVRIISSSLNRATRSIKSLPAITDCPSLEKSTIKETGSSGFANRTVEAGVA